MQKYVIALYIRLSIEDYKYDSLSIEKPSVAAAVMHYPAPCRKPRITIAAIPRRTKKAAATRCA